MAGRRTRITQPDANYWVNTYDVLNRLTETPRQGTTTVLGTRTYTAQGRPAAMTWTNSALSANQTSWTFDAGSGRLSGMAINVHGTASDATWSFTSNPASQLASETRDNDAYAFGDHIAADLTIANNGLNQYLSVFNNANSTTLMHAHDANCNLTADGSRTYVYDTENRMVSMVNGATTVTLRYDPLGRLYETATNGTVNRRLYYDGQDLALEYNAAVCRPLRRFMMPAPLWVTIGSGPYSGRAARWPPGGLRRNEMLQLWPVLAGLIVS